MNVLKWAGLIIAVEAVFVALWIAAHGGLKDDETVAREAAADVKSQLTSDERYAKQALRVVEDQR